MKVKRSGLIALFKELGSDTADKWPVDRLEGKVKKLPKQVVEDEAEAKTADSKTLLKKILAALKAEDDIEITDDVAGKAKPAKAQAPTPEPEDDDAADDDVSDEPDEEDTEVPVPDDEDDDAPVAKKPAAKKAAKKNGAVPGKKIESAGVDGKPGVIASILEFLGTATEEKPINKDRMADRLAKRFPDRDRDSMMKTINVQVPNRIKKDRGLDVQKSEKGYWITPESLAKAEKAAAKKQPKKEKAPVAVADEDDD